MEGIIVKNISNDYTVVSEGERFICKARGKFRHSNVVPLVGDRVVFDGEGGIILDILPRRNTLIRPSVSNIDVAFVMASVSPRLDLVLLDKMLTIISFNNIEPVICFTKMDLIGDEKERDKYTGLMDYYRGIHDISPAHLIKFIMPRCMLAPTKSLGYLISLKFQTTIKPVH